MDLIKSN